MYQGSEVPLYVTKDGENLVQGVLPFSALEDTPSNAPSNTEEIPKADVPEVELFVMTHCPYGTQAEKGFIPAILEFGDSIDASIKFVHYFLHDPEETETPIQVCIREEQSDKFNAYLKCFLEDGDSDRCILETGIDRAKMQDCIDSGKADDYYAADSALSEGYGVRGSPTLVVNGEIVSSGRSAAAYADIICQAFNNAPELCGELDLDSANPSPGFGYGTSSGISNAQC
jgi:glutaredoxin